jgi:hypothetical protein
LALSVSPHLDALNHIWDTLRKDKSKEKGIVYLGGIAEFFATVVAPYLSPLRKAGICLHYEIGYENMVQKLLSDELDLVQLWAPVVHPGV